MKKYILTDIDDAIVDWSTPFSKWIHDRGEFTAATPTLQECKDIEQWLGVDIPTVVELVTEFNGTPEIWENFEALEGAREAVKELQAMGYTFIGITACDDSEESVAGRKKNLQNVFGDAFEEVYCVGLHGSKKEALSKYHPTFWVEDKWSNAILGAELGHFSMLMSYPHTANLEDDRVVKVDNWGEIVRLVKAADVLRAVG